MRKMQFAIAALAVFWATQIYARPVQDEGGTNCPKDAVCGSLLRPLDPTGRVKGNISIAYRLYKHLDSAKPTAGTIVAQEGGPGFSTFGSAYGYLELFRPLRQDHDMVMVDERGTGRSGAIRCPSVQHTLFRTPSDVGACGRSLGKTADLYGTTLAAEDMAAVLDTLHIDKIDYYGDSYGTFFGQVFSGLYPNRLRSVVLDSAYPVIGETPWYSHAGDVVRKGFNEVCKLSPYCAGLEGSSLNRIRKVVDYVAKNPISGREPDGEGKMHHTTVDPGLIGLMLYGGTEGPINYRELDAAIRAWFDNNDPAPLVRLGSENLADEYPQPPRQYSYGLFSAVSCMDYQQIYDMNSPVSDRHKQRDAAIARREQNNPKTYDPLTIEQFETVPIDISVLNFCLDWPIHNPPYTPGIPIPDGSKFTDAPTLVLNGGLDMLTTAAEGAIVTSQYPHGQQLIVANSFHVVAVDDVDDCAEQIVRNFVATLQTGDTSCAAKINPVRLVPFFARHAADAIPATPDSGDTANTHDLALASAAVQTAGDVLARWYINYGGTGKGLRGGTWSYSQPRLVASYKLNDVRWAEDLAVSGAMQWDLHNGAIQAHLTFADKSGAKAKLTATWNDRDTDGIAKLSGMIDDRTVLATMPAP